jgi:hypothetical protein
MVSITATVPGALNCSCANAGTPERLVAASSVRTYRWVRFMTLSFGCGLRPRLLLTQAYTCLALGSRAKATRKGFCAHPEIAARTNWRTHRLATVAQLGAGAAVGCHLTSETRHSNIKVRRLQKNH